jgi:hypothetical protein
MRRREPTPRASPGAFLRGSTPSPPRLGRPWTRGLGPAWDQLRPKSSPFTSPVSPPSPPLRRAAAKPLGRTLPSGRSASDLAEVPRLQGRSADARARGRCCRQGASGVTGPRIESQSVLLRGRSCCGGGRFGRRRPSRAAPVSHRRRQSGAPAPSTGWPEERMASDRASASAGAVRAKNRDYRRNRPFVAARTRSSFSNENRFRPGL